MRHTIREFPNYFPHATLYVDDLEAIVQIFSEAIRKDIEARVSRGNPTEPLYPGEKVEIQVQYKNGREVMDSVSDLLDQGGSVKDLELEVETIGFPRATCLLHLRGTSAPYWFSRGLSESTQWETYGKVLQIIGKRRSFLKNVVEGLPNWIGPVSGVIGAIAFVSAEVLNKTLRSAVPAIIVMTLALAMLVIVAAIAVVDFGPFNRVHLVRSHERSKISRAARRKYAVAAFTFVLGVLFTKFVDWIFAHWLK